MPAYVKLTVGYTLRKSLSYRKVRTNAVVLKVKFPFEECQSEQTEQDIRHFFKEDIYMIKDKEGNKVALKDILGHLIGTDADDMAKSVIDFSLYPVNEDKTIGDPQYYLVAAEAIVTQISFMGPFTMLELDFRNIGNDILQQVMGVINKFHSDINTDNIIMVSTITSLEKESKHIMSLANPLICVRGYSDKGEGTTILQLVYATDNIGFSAYEIDFAKIEADIERERREFESMQVTKEAISAAQEVIDESTDSNDAMQDMFRPDFGITTPEMRRQQNNHGIRQSFGSESDNTDSRNASRIKNSDNSKITEIHESEED